MLARFRDWLLARVKARTEAELARSKERAALATPETPSANFVDELERLLGRDDADHPRGGGALSRRQDGESGECLPTQKTRLPKRGGSCRPFPFVRGQTPRPRHDLPRR